VPAFDHTGARRFAGSCGPHLGIHLGVVPDHRVASCLLSAAHAHPAPACSVPDASPRRQPGGRLFALCGPSSHPPPPQWQRPEDMGQQLDPQHQSASFSGGSLTAAALLADPGTPFYRMTGFELAPSVLVNDRPSATWAELQRLVGAHDQDGVDDFVVAAGAPTTSGFGVPSCSRYCSRASRWLRCGAPTWACRSRQACGVSRRCWPSGRGAADTKRRRASSGAAVRPPQ
jgi:hypothetical protein